MTVPNTSDPIDSTAANTGDSSTPATSIPVRIPSRPPIRSTGSAASFASASSTGSSSSPAHLSDRPVAEVTFRHGRIEDAPFMTDMQFSNALYHYRECAPKVFLDSLNYPAMTANHVKRMTPPVDKREMVYVVAEREHPKTGELEVIGMSQAMVPWWDRAYNHRFFEGWSQDDFDCEIETLYVKVGVQGGGLGRKLVLGALQEGYDRLNMRGAVIIWTLEDNYQAKDFYTRIGCVEVARRTLDLCGIPCECLAYGFRSVGETIGK